MDFGPKRTVGPGALVELAQRERRLIVAVPSQEFLCQGVPVLGISTSSPLYLAMEGAEAGDAFEFRGTSFTIERVD